MCEIFTLYSLTDNLGKLLPSSRKGYYHCGYYKFPRQQAFKTIALHALLRVPLTLIVNTLSTVKFIKHSSAIGSCFILGRDFSSAMAWSMRCELSEWIETSYPSVSYTLEPRRCKCFTSSSIVALAENITNNKLMTLKDTSNRNSSNYSEII